MKVYYTVPETFEFPDSAINEILEDLPKEYFSPIKGIIENNLWLQKTAAIEFGEKWKYKIMWELRALEKEIEAEGGCIIITDKGKIHTKDFSPELTEKIKSLLQKIN